MFLITEISSNKPLITMADINYDPTERLYLFKSINNRWYSDKYPVENYYEVPKNKENLDKHLLDIRSSKPQIIDSVYMGIFHMLYDGILRFWANKDFFINNDVELVIDTAHFSIWPFGRSIFDLNIRVYDRLGIKYKVIDTTAREGLISQTLINFHDIFPMNVSQNTIIEFNNFLNTEFNLGWETKEPTKKVYVSRNKIDRMNTRIQNEIALHQYLEDNGFEIIYTEEFGSIFDQIKFMSEVKTLASVTSSGITNSLFMKPGSNILEFTTAFTIEGRTELHTQYPTMAYNLSHKYYSVPNLACSAETLIPKIHESRVLEIL